MSENTNKRLQQASLAWSRLFQNTNPRKQPTRTTSEINNANHNHTPRSHHMQQTITITQDNLTKNISWGDEIQEKSTNIIRIYAQNLNGVKIQSDGGQYKEICEMVKEVKADIFCFQEHNLDTTQYRIRKTLHDTTTKQWQRARLTIASSPIPFSGQWKPGGTAILTNGYVTGRITATGQDNWGRWSYHTIIGSRCRQVTIISAYQVVAQRQALKGQYTTATQQQSLLMRQQDKITDPRTAFRRDLITFLKQLQAKKHGIILLGDFNERLGDDPAGMSRIATEFNLMDLMRLQHPHLSDVATYARGRKRLDYVLGSADIANSVENCGYEPFNYRYCTDHRAYFVDLNTKILFGTTIQPLAKYSDRILHSNNIKQVTKYIQEKHKMLKACNAFERGHRLENPDNRNDFAERLDADVVRSSLSAEKRIKKYKEPAWSIELANARKKVSILQKALSMAKTRIDNTTIIQQEMNKLSSPILFPETIQECSQELRNAKREVAEIIQRSFETRESEREKQIANLETEITDTKAATVKIKILRNLKKAEELRKLFLKIKTLRQTKNRNGITRIEVPCDPNEDPKACIHWKMVDIPTEILQHLQQRNRRHFGQAYGTPFTVPPLVEDLGFTGDTQQGSMILDGTYDATHLDHAVQTVIQHLHRTTYSQQQPVTPTISQSAYLGKINKWRESTSTSPSGLHLGHYKAMTARHEFSDFSDKDPRKAEFESQRNEIIKLHMQLLNYGLERGYSFTRWQQVANTMLFKEPGNIKIHKTRVIHLYEADYNLAMGLKWKAALDLSEEGKTLNSGQYGSRPSRGAQDPVFIEEFQLEISRASRKTLLQTNYDATSCYDRIIPNLAALVSQKYGVPLPAVLVNVKTLQAAKYKLKTELGISDKWYTHSNEYPIYGTGQGSGNSPMIWCFISSVLFDCYDRQAYGAIYELPDRSLTTKMHMVGYVDDSNGQTNQFLEDQQPTDREIIKLAQHDAQTWHDLLQATGGALEIPKCVYQLISWTFKADGSPFLKGYDNTHEIIVFNKSTNTAQEIPGISAYTAHKTLGHFKDPDGNQTKQRSEIEKKCKQANEFMANSPLTREEAWTYYFSIFQTSVGYPLAASHFKKSTLDVAQRQFMSTLIAKCGYNRKTKREIIYGPACLGGANFRSLHTIQGTGQVLAFIKYWRSPSQAGKLLRVAVAWTQYSIGTGTSFLSDTTTPLPQMEVKWLKSLRDYLNHIGGSLQLDCTYIPNLEREHDHYIMDVIMRSAQFSPTQIKTLNYCRMYLQAFSLSDIINATGDALDMQMLNGNIGHITSSTSRWHHFHQQRPNEAAWQLWREANSLWSGADRKMYQPLTRWLLPPSRQRRTWPVYADRKQHLYAMVDNTNESSHQRRYRVRRWHSISDRGQPVLLEDRPNAAGLVPYTTSIPDHAIPVAVETDKQGTVRLDFTRQKIIHHYHQPTKISQVSAQGDFYAYLQQLDEWEFELLANVQLIHDAFTTLAKMRTKGFLAAGDGSVRHEHFGAFGWIISTSDGERIVRANGPARGYRPTSYRAEGYGILSILRFLKRLLLYCNEDPDWQWEMTSDNLSLVDTVNGTEADEDGLAHQTKGWVAQSPNDWSTWQEISPNDIEDSSPETWSASEHSTTNSTLVPDWDVLNEIRWSMTQDGLRGAVLKHIKGHQDRAKKYGTLSLRAQLNVDADALATKYQEEHGQALPIVLMFPHAAVSLQLHHGTCTSHIPTAVRKAENYQPLAQYIRTRNQWSQQQFDSINWTALQYAIKRKNKQRIHITKLIHDLLPTNKTLHRHNLQAQKCPSCTSCIQEDRDHIMRCGAIQRETWRADTIMALEQKCHQLNTDKGLAAILVYGVSQWLNGHDLGCDASIFPQKYNRMISHQNRIGWRQLFNGRMCSEWARMQDDHVYNTKRRRADNISAHEGNSRQSPNVRMRSGTQWTGEIIIILWDQWYKVWTMRNSVIHGYDQESRAKHQREVDMKRLQSIYQSRHLMEPSAQDMLFPTLEEHQQARGSTAIHNWLSIHETTFIQSVKKASKRAIRGVRSIKTYFAGSKSAALSDDAYHQTTAATPNTIPHHIKRPRTIMSYFATGRPPDTKTQQQQGGSTPTRSDTQKSPA